MRFRVTVEATIEAEDYDDARRIAGNMARNVALIHGVRLATPGPIKTKREEIEPPPKRIA
jgi:hypothetical protein